MCIKAHSCDVAQRQAVIRTSPKHSHCKLCTCPHERFQAMWWAAPRDVVTLAASCMWCWSVRDSLLSTCMSISELKRPFCWHAPLIDRIGDSNRGDKVDRLYVFRLWTWFYVRTRYVFYCWAMTRVSCSNEKPCSWTTHSKSAKDFAFIFIDLNGYRIYWTLSNTYDWNTKHGIARL